MKFYHSGDGDYTLTIEQEYLDTGPYREPDPDWSFTDSAGHIHKYGKDFSTPTLKEEAYTEWEACWECGCGHQETFYRTVCVECGEEVYPGTRYKPGEKIAGLRACHGSLTQDHPSFEKLRDSLGGDSVTFDIEKGVKVLGAIVNARTLNSDGAGVIDFVASGVERRIE